MKSLALLLALALSASAALLSTCRSTSAAEAHHRNHHHHHHVKHSPAGKDAGNDKARSIRMASEGSDKTVSKTVRAGALPAAIPLPRTRSAYFSLEEALVRRAIWELREAELRSLFPKKEGQ